jgi:hypothetical protein
MDAWITNLLTALGTTVVTAAGLELRLRRKIRLMRAREETRHRENEDGLQRTIRGKDAELDALKKEQKIRESGIADKLQHGNALTDLAIKAQQNGISFELLAQCQEFFLEGKKVRLATATEAAKPDKEDRRIVDLPSGERRRVWTDKESGQQVWEYVARTEQEVQEKRDFLRSWHHWCSVGFACVSGAEKKKQGLPLTPLEESADETFFQSEFHEQCQKLPQVTTEMELHFIAAKFEALAWVTGWEFGWPERNGEKLPSPAADGLSIRMRKPPK